MFQRLFFKVVSIGLVGSSMSLGCGVPDEDHGELAAEHHEALAAATKRCTIQGDPAVEQGCDPGDLCVPYACTSSIPPSCVGTCKKPAPVKAARCDVSGAPPIATGCTGSQTCALEGCTNSIPPHCFGHCE